MVLNMTVGKKLWIIILIKLFIIFFVLRLFFFPDFLKSRFKSDKERGDYVREQLIKRNKYSHFFIYYFFLLLDSPARRCI